MSLALGRLLRRGVPDVFLLTRTGPGSKLTLLLNDSGTISCDGGKQSRSPMPG